MAEIRVLDDYYLAITLLITIAYQLFFFSIAFSLKFDKLTDFAGGTNFTVLAIITLAFSGHHNARQIVVSLFIMLWALRLSGFLLFRIIRTGKDDRFDDKRDKFFPFLGFWIFQMLWVWTVSLPVTVLNSPNVTQYAQHRFGSGRDIAGVILFAIGFVMESVSDVQKFRFRTQHKDSGAVCDVGFFKWTRHPNYFGEIVIQFSIYMIATSPAADGYVGGGAYRALYATILGPLFLTILLMFVSGLPLQERPGAKKRYEKGDNWNGYATYLHRTSILIPFPPQLYARMPVFLKRTLFLEFPIYVFDPAKHADHGKVQQSQAEEGRGGVSGSVRASEDHLGEEEENNPSSKRFNELKAELEELHKSNADVDAASTEGVLEDDATKHYLSLCRQRRQYEKLCTIQGALSQISSIQPHHAVTHVKDVVYEELGDPPEVPAAIFDSQPHEDGVQDLTFRLKKAVLEAKHATDTSNSSDIARTTYCDRTSLPAATTEVFALRRARDELVSWIEGELAKLSGGPAGRPESEDHRPSNELDRDARGTANVDDIRKLYQRYVSSRKDLLITMDHASAVDPNNMRPPTKLERESRVGAIQDSEVKPICATELLPNLHGLLRTSAAEKSVLQSTSYNRRQLAVAQNWTNETVMRLADESHLVVPGTSNVTAWASAAEEASAATNDFVKGKLDAGDGDLAGAKLAFEELQIALGAFDRLDGGF